MAILLVRHGETALNAARIVQVPSTPLSARGLRQARLLGERLRGDRIGLILSSDQLRARMTAECVQLITGVPLELEPLLQERNFGRIRGTPYSELNVDIFSQGYHPPGGEGWEEFHQRVDRAWRRVTELAGRLDRDLLVVSHGLVCGSLAERQLELAEVPADGWGNTCLTRIEGGPPWVAELVACTAHLRANPTGAGAPA